MIIGVIAVTNWRKGGPAGCEEPCLINDKTELVPDEKANLLDKVYGVELLPQNY